MTSTLDAQTAALRSSTESSPTELALELQKALGQKLVVFMLDVRAQTFADWAKGQAKPRGSNLENLRHLARIHKMLAAYDDEHTIRAWFIGLNHLLDDMAPAEVFREGDIRSVQTAARKFIEHA